MSPDSRLKRLALGTASIFLLIVGTLLNVPQMYLMAVALSLIPLVFWCIGLFLQRGLICDRYLPTTCERGERVKVDLVLRNVSIFPKFYVRAFDRLPRWVKFDGTLGDDGSMLLQLAPNETAQITYYVRAFKRGLQTIGPTRLSNPDLIGLANYSKTLNQPAELLVFPEVIPLNAQFFSGGSARGWRDQENATTRGTGTDFQGVREYQIGDDLRRVNWKTTARTGKLAVTEYALGYANDMTIALDLAESSYGGDDQGVDSAFEKAIEITASIAVAALRQGSSVQIITNGDIPEIASPMRGQEFVVQVLTSLALAEPTSTKSLVQTLSAFEEVGSQERSLIVITGMSPYSAELNDALEDLRRARNGMVPVIFWLDKNSFATQHSFSYANLTEEVHRVADIYESALGKNIVIRRDSELRELFSRASI